jgi:hypothetical protein
MGPERDVDNLSACPRVDDCQRAAAIADEQSVCRRVEADVVGVVAEVDAARRREIGALEQANRAVAGIGDIVRTRSMALTRCARSYARRSFGVNHERPHAWLGAGHLLHQRLGRCRLLAGGNADRSCRL